MARPGIILARSGLLFAVERLEEAEKAHATSPTLVTEANIVRSGCESLFWLFALSEDFKELIEASTSQTIHEWWSTRVGNIAGVMNGLRFIRNRVTHSYKYYWLVWDLNNLKWGEIEPPTQEELNGPAGRYVQQQYSDYQTHLEGHGMSEPLNNASKVMQRMYMKFDLKTW